MPLGESGARGRIPDRHADPFLPEQVESGGHGGVALDTAAQPIHEALFRYAEPLARRRRAAQPLSELGRLPSPKVSEIGVRVRQLTRRDA